MKKSHQKQKTEELLTLIGVNIKKLRLEKGWTQEQLAEAARINDKEVSHIEYGNRNITIETLVKISLAFGVEAKSLISDSQCSTIDSN